MIDLYNQPQRTTAVEKVNQFITKHEPLIIGGYMALMALAIAKTGHKLINKSDKNNGCSTVEKPLDLTVEPLDEPVNLTVDEPLDQPFEAVKEPLPTAEEEAEVKERIRQVMSMMGRKSAAARAKKRETETMPNME